MSQRGYRVLIIINDLAKGETVARFLHAAGFGVSTAPDAKVAVDKFETDPADIVIVDQLKGATRTLSAMRKLRGLGEFGAQVPVVLADSPEWDDTMVSAAQDIGVSKFIFDPFDDLEMLLDVVRETLGIVDEPPPAQAPHRPAVEVFQPPPGGVEVVVEQTRSSAPPPSGGDVDARHIVELLAKLFERKSTGRLTLSNGDATKAIYLKSGSPVLVDSRLPEETLGAFLEQKGLLTPEQRKEAEHHQRADGGLHGQFYLEKGWIGPNELFEHLTAHQTEKVLSCFGWDAGSYVFTEGVELEKGVVPLKLDLPRLLLDGIKRYLDFKRVYRLLNVADDTMIVARPDAPVSPEQLKLNTGEARIYDLARRGIAVGELLSLSTSNLAEVLQTLYGFRLLGMISLSGGSAAAGLGRSVSAGAPTTTRGMGRAAASTSSSAVVAPASSVQQGHPSVSSERASGLPEPRSATCGVPTAKGSENPAASDDEMLSELGSLLNADYFELLGVDRDVPASEVRPALQRLAKRFAPDALSAFSAEVRVMGSQVLKKLVDASEVLSDMTRRAEYIERLEYEEVARSSSVPENLVRATCDEDSAPKRRVLKGRPRDLLEKAKRAVEEGRYNLAITHLESARQEESDSSSILSWLGWTTYNLHPDDASEAELYLTEGRRHDPSNPEPFLFLARIRAEQGELDKALAFYEAATNADPHDVEVAHEARQFRITATEMAKNPKAKRRSVTPAARGSRPAEPNEDKAATGILNSDVGSLLKKVFKK